MFAPPLKKYVISSLTRTSGLAHHSLRRVPLMTPIFFLGAEVWQRIKKKPLVAEGGRITYVSSYPKRWMGGGDREGKVIFVQGDGKSHA